MQCELQSALALKQLLLDSSRVCDSLVCFELLATLSADVLFLALLAAPSATSAHQLLVQLQYALSCGIHRGADMDLCAH